MSFRVGLGFDSHQLVPGRPCVLGGIECEYPLGPEGHSDGDAILHALIDALLGAAGLSDLGTLFPDSDPEWKGADSANLLSAAHERVKAEGWSVVNVDIVVATEGPRIAPRRAELQERLSQLLGVQTGAVNVKGKSLEGLGALSTSDGIAVQAICLLTDEC